ncbi:MULTISPECIES: redox-active disulfide protein 2 [Sphingobacterium]|uniref:redox-active disulfide protein 2 n=1 Tax=Sphingobacterium TaxID=28453 RepID=UPI002954EE95|nr:redox-active disulfide protein 2 [Sphingobacterium sp. UGAL515B_05]WON94629.1 redox-active disulfide protein 2 [Sphingobacterium sp. UGAL515B_05]
MNNRPLNGMTNEELQTNKKNAQVITWMLTAMLLILLGMGIYTSISKGFSALMAIPFALSPIVILNFKRIKEINEELKIRGAQ